MRKTPRQARSREMVERLVEAGRKVLAKEGYDAFSTNRVAEAAGVSPGSLYQYFPDKSALLDVIRDRYWDDVATRVAASLADRADAPGPTRIRDTADALLTALEADTALLRVINYELPIVQIRDRRTALEQRVRELLTVILRTHPHLSQRPDPSAAAWVVVLALENLTLRWILDQPRLTRDALLDEIEALVGGYAQMKPKEPVLHGLSGRDHGTSPR
jgi:AcrR family transcriptional regulator